MFVCGVAGWIAIKASDLARSSAAHALLNKGALAALPLLPSDARLLRGWSSSIGITWEPIHYDEIVGLSLDSDSKGKWYREDGFDRAACYGTKVLVANLAALLGMHMLGQYWKTMRSRRSQEFTLVFLICAALIGTIPTALVNGSTTAVLGFWSEVCGESTGMAWVVWSRFSVGGVHVANLAMLVFVALFCQRFVLEFFARRGTFLPTDERLAIEGRCPNCGYNTTGLQGCPECGHGRSDAPQAEFSVKRITRVTCGVLIGIAVIGSMMPLIAGCARGLFLMLRRSMSV